MFGFAINEFVFGDYSTEDKKCLVSTIFPDNLIFNGEANRTPLHNEAPS